MLLQFMTVTECTFGMRADFSKGSITVPAWNSINLMLYDVVHSQCPQAGVGVMPLAPGPASPGRTGLTASTLIGFFQGRF